jgi:hypothetical protein
MQPADSSSRKSNVEAVAMRVSGHFCIESLKKALTQLGYCHLSLKRSNVEWRRHEYHLTVRDKGKRGVAVQLHEDLPSSLPPFHRARHESKSLQAEMNKILEAYRRIRQVEH